MKFIWWHVTSQYKDFPSSIDDPGTYMFSGFDGAVVSLLPVSYTHLDKLKEITNKNHLLFYKEIINYERNHGLYKGIMDENGNIINEK